MNKLINSRASSRHVLQQTNMYRLTYVSISLKLQYIKFKNRLTVKFNLITYQIWDESLVYP